MVVKSSGSQQADDGKLRQALAQLVILARTHGHSTEQVEHHVREHADLEGFKELAIALLVMLKR